MVQAWSNINQASPAQVPQLWHPVPDGPSKWANDLTLTHVAGTGSLDRGIQVYVQE